MFSTGFTKAKSKIYHQLKGYKMELIYPMFSMVILTAIVGLATAYVRIKSAYSGAVNPKYFRLMSNYEITETVAKFGRNLDNLFEVPVLFYVAGASAIALEINSNTILILMWAFVALRIIHTTIHLTYNHPPHRFVPFIPSFFCVVGIWFNILVGFMKKHNKEI